MNDTKQTPKSNCLIAITKVFPNDDAPTAILDVNGRIYCAKPGQALEPIRIMTGTTDPDDGTKIEWMYLTRKNVRKMKFFEEDDGFIYLPSETLEIQIERDFNYEIASALKRFFEKELKEADERAERESEQFMTLCPYATRPEK